MFQYGIHLIFIAILAGSAFGAYYLPFIYPSVVKTSYSDAHVQLPSMVHFGSSQYDTIYIALNGLVSFKDHPYGAPTSFPITSHVIAPYWDSYSHDEAHQLQYKIITARVAVKDQTLINQLNEVMTSTIGSTFKADWILWIMWRTSANCTHNFANCDKVNVFQQILAVKGDITYTVFVYKCGSIHYTNDLATVGFSANSNFYSNHPLSKTSHVTNVDCYDATTEWNNVVYGLSKINIEIPPVITRMYATVQRQFLRFQNNISVNLNDKLTIGCVANGNPIPSVTWYKDGHAITSQSNVLTISKVNLTDRGFYKCSATNNVGTVLSKEVLLNITGILQYKLTINLADETTERLFANTSMKLQEYLDVSQYSLLSIGNYMYKKTHSVLTFIVTLFGPDEVGSERISHLLTEAVEYVIEQYFPLSIILEVDNAIRFDGCPSMSHSIPYTTRDPFPELQINWPETNIGDTAVVTCPCSNNVELSSTNLQATKKCGGNFTDGAVWQSSNDVLCNFSDVAREICFVSEKGTVELIESLEELTNDTTSFQASDVIVSVSVLVTANLSGNSSLTDMFFNVIDNLAVANKTVLQTSQQQANTSAKLLNSLMTVTEQLTSSTSDDNYTNPQGGTPMLLLQSSFAVAIQQINKTSFQKNGQTLNAIFPGYDFTRQHDLIDSSNLELNGNSSVMSTASIRVPGEAFNNISNASELVHFVFLTDSLFLRRNNNNKEVGSIIVSASVTGTSISGLKNPVIINFLRNPNITNDTSQACVYWDPMLDGGYGDWSSEGCTVKTSTDTNIVCHCTHLTSFSILMDVSPTLQNKPRSTDKIISAISYIGIIVSICCLLLIITSYLCVRKLRLSDHGQLLISLCLSLLGLYVMFIFAIHSPKVTSLCGVISFLLHYFFLVTFLNMAAESINLYCKLVIVLGSNISHYVIKTVIISWLLPVLIVLFCFVTNYRNYISDHFCRAYNIPYYIGMLGPFIAIYIFNWIIFVIIFVSLLKKFLSKDIQKAKQDSTRKQLYQQFNIVITLSILFGLGWGIGLAATQQSFTNQIVPDILSGLFVCLTGFHGLFIFVLYFLRNESVKNLWKRWLYEILNKKRNRNFSNIPTLRMSSALRRSSKSVEEGSYPLRKVSCTSSTTRRESNVSFPDMELKSKTMTIGSEKEDIPINTNDYDQPIISDEKTDNEKV